MSTELWGFLQQIAKSATICLSQFLRVGIGIAELLRSAIPLLDQEEAGGGQASVARTLLIPLPDQEGAGGGQSSVARTLLIPLLLQEGAGGGQASVAPSFRAYPERGEGVGIFRDCPTCCLSSFSLGMGSLGALVSWWFNFLLPPSHQDTKNGRNLVKRPLSDAGKLRAFEGNITVSILSDVALCRKPAISCSLCLGVLVVPE